MKNQLELVIPILLLSACLMACKFTAGDAATSDSSSSNAANRAVTKTEPSNKRVSSKADKTETAAVGDDEEPNDSQKDDYKLEILRSFPSLEKPDGPPRHGDYSYFKELENGGTAGSLYLTKPREAVFIIWDGEVIAGPLTTVEEIEETYALLSKQSAEAHELRMEIMKNYPTGRNKRVRVYDSDGNLIREEDQ